MDEAGLELEIHEKRRVITPLQSFTAGCVSGMSSIVVGQPFDTIKVRLQTGAHSGPSECLRQLIAKEGGTALFKGMSSPVVSAALLNAIVFCSYNETMKVLTHNDVRAAKYSDYFIGGAVSGLVQCSVLCPVELLKCRLQVQTANSRYQGPIDCAREIAQSRGLRGFYQGLVPLMAREAPAVGVYFCQYEVMKDHLNGRMPLWASSFAAGSIAGLLSWALVYPVDVVKSVVQIQPLSAPREQRSVWGTVRRLYAAHGMAVFWRGLGVTLLRALPVNGIVFPTYEITVAALQEFQQKQVSRELPL